MRAINSTDLLVEGNTGTICGTCSSLSELQVLIICEVQGHTSSAGVAGNSQLDSCLCAGLNLNSVELVNDAVACGRIILLRSSGSSGGRRSGVLSLTITNSDRQRTSDIINIAVDAGNLSRTILQLTGTDGNSVYIVTLENVENIFAVCQALRQNEIELSKCILVCPRNGLVPSKHAALAVCFVRSKSIEVDVFLNSIIVSKVDIVVLCSEDRANPISITCAGAIVQSTAIEAVRIREFIVGNLNAIVAEEVLFVLANSLVAVDSHLQRENIHTSALGNIQLNRNLNFAGSYVSRSNGYRIGIAGTEFQNCGVSSRCAKHHCASQSGRCNSERSDSRDKLSHNNLFLSVSALLKHKFKCIGVGDYGFPPAFS